MEPSMEVIVSERTERPEKPLLYDAKGKPLTRPVGFRAPAKEKR